MKKKKVLIAYQLPKAFFGSLGDDYELVFPTNRSFTEDEITKLLPECDAMVSIFGHKVPDAAIKNNKKTKIISNFGAGYDNINSRLAAENGISVTNTPKEVLEPTAELALGLMLNLCRKISLSDHQIRNKSEKWGAMENLGSTLSGKTLGIIGMGNIGQDIAQKARVFNMNINYYQRSPLSIKQEKELNATYMQLNDLLSSCDIISLSVPLNTSTHHLINKDTLALMKKSAFLINTSRGAVVDEDALVQALKTGEIAGTALDVYENEPEIHPDLRKIENTILVPHIGTATIETRQKMAERACQNIIDFFAGKPLAFLVNAV